MATELALPFSMAENLLQNDPVLSAIADQILKEECFTPSSPDDDEAVGLRAKGQVRRTKSPQNDQSRVCLVCGGFAGRFSFYGGQVCTSCRGFFRRVVMGNTVHKLKCSNASRHNFCTIDPSSRTNCRHCRYQLCLQSGMNPKWVSKGTKESLVKPNQLVSAGPMGLLPDELAVLQRDEQRERDSIIARICRIYISHPTLLESTLNAVYFGVRMPKDVRKFWFKSSISFTHDHFAEEETFRSLNPHDKHRLLAANIPLLLTFVLSSALNMTERELTRSWLMTSMRKKKAENEDCQLVSDRMRVLSLDSNLKTTGIAYAQVFETDSAERRLKDDQLRHKQVMDRINLWSRGRKTSVQGRKTAVGADDYVGYLLRMIILLSADHVTGLCDPEAVEALQLTQIRRLQARREG